MKIEYNTKEQELDFVGFIDSIDATKSNFLSNEEAFLNS
jgi:hypothetical protein